MVNHEETPKQDLDQVAARGFGQLALGLYVTDGAFLVPINQGESSLETSHSGDNNQFPGFETGWHILDLEEGGITNGEWKESMVVLAKDYKERPGNVVIKRVSKNEFIGWQAPMREAQAKAKDKQFRLQLEKQNREAAEQTKRRHEKIFAPVGSPKKEPQDNDYDLIFAEDEIFDDRLANLIKLRGLVNTREFVTDENRSTACDLLNNIKIDPGITKIIRSAFPGKNALDLEVVDEIRANADLRLALGEHFLSRQEFYVDNNDYSIQRSVWPYLPDRVSRNTQKNPNHIGYEGLDLKSQEYVALLCLSMLDGSFDYNAASSDPINIKEDGEVVYGQHRAAARLVLLNEIPKQKNPDN